jgi:para-aminobenzoate synthetase/4-amino-4-deoxychorismate lyase
VRLQDGVFPAQALQLHLQRLEAAARHFGYPFDGDAVQAALQRVARAHAHGVWRVRLRLDAAGTAQAEAFAHAPDAPSVRVQLAPAPIDAPAEFLRFKTTRREHLERFAPRDPAVFDTLLWNARGEVTEFTRGNVIAELPDGRRITPPLRCGLLDGVGRAMALQRGEVTEAVLRVEDLPHLRSLHFVNALRGSLPATLLQP